MLTGKTIGIIGGGNMAGALVRGLLAGHAVEPSQLVVSDVRAEALLHLAETHGVRTSTDNRAVAAAADVAILAVKPQILDRVLSEVAETLRPTALVVSIAAGVPIDAIARRLPAGTRIVRVMPNTPAMIGCGAAGLAPGANATADDLQVVQRIFESVGVAFVLEEAQLDAVTGLSGSGPAYVFLIIEALADAGVKVGLHREVAQHLAAQTVLGSAKLLLETGEHPGRLKDMVTSPGGTAIAGLATLEAGGLRTTLINAVETATTRSRQLGEEMAAKLAR